MSGIFCTLIGQKTPSAKRCIKAKEPIACNDTPVQVRKHRTPKGALRIVTKEVPLALHLRQKAPSTKRCIKTHLVANVIDFAINSQKAPSAKRCINTSPYPQRSSPQYTRVRKHRAPKGALRHAASWGTGRSTGRSESTERQKVHSDGDRREVNRGGEGHEKAPSAKRCIRTTYIPSTRV